MKTILTTLLFLWLASSFAVIQPAGNLSPDALIAGRLDEAEKLNLLLLKSENPDSTRLYAKQLMQVCDDTRNLIRKFYSYKGQSMAPVISVGSNNKTALIFVMLQEKEPFAASQFGEMFTQAQYLRVFNVKSENRKRKNCQRIAGLIDELRVFMKG